MTNIPQFLHVRDEHPLAPRLEIKVNGVVQDMVIEYNIPLGRVVRYETGPDGNIVIRGDSAAIETVTGDVTVTLRDE